MKSVVKSERVCWIIASILMLAGTTMLLRTVLVSRTLIDGLYKKHDRIHHLALMKYEADGLRSAVLTLERDTSTRPTDIRELTRTYLENADVTSTLLEPEATIYGWQVQRVELTFEQLTWEEVSLFLRKVEEQRPPWRVKQMSLTPGNSEGLSGKLLLHAVQKSEI